MAASPPLIVSDSASRPAYAYGEGIDQRLVLRGVPWRTYVLLDDAIDQPSVKVSYYRGELEIMTKGSRHEVGKKLLARLLELWALERDVALYGYGETTFRDDLEQAGLEPDECYTIGGPLQRIPDLAIEVVVTSGGVDKLAIYFALGVREVWMFEGGALSVHCLTRKGYRASAKSALLPGLDLRALVRHANIGDQHEAVKAFRDVLRGKAKKSVRAKRGKGR